MVEVNRFPRLGFEFPFDEAAAYDAEVRGYLSHVFVQFENGDRCSVVFYNPVRLQQDLEVESEAGRAYIAEPGMIVIPEVTLAHMNNAVAKLFAIGYFDTFKHER